jgi:hypothetical protein
MSIHTHTEVFYGVKVEKHIPAGEKTLVSEWLSGHALWGELYEQFEDEEVVAPNVRRWLAGGYNSKDVYLVIDIDGHLPKALEPGESREIDVRFQNMYLPWNHILRQAAESLGLTVMRGPFWFVVADES